MIRNNLAILMSERGIKNSVLSIKTGISKNTISSTAQNDGKMIQLETINKLCQVLEVTPNEFFSFIPLDIDIKILVNDFKSTFQTNEFHEIFKIYVTDIDIDLILNLKKNNIVVDTLVFEVENFDKENLISSNPIFFIEFDGDEETHNSVKKFFKDIPTAFVTDIKKQIESEIILTLKKEFKKIELDIPFELPFDFDSFIDSLKFIVLVPPVGLTLPY